VQRYRVDGGKDEDLFWIEAGDRREAERALSQLSLPTREVFTFDLLRDVGASLASPATSSTPTSPPTSSMTTMLGTTKHCVLSGCPGLRERAGMLPIQV
jgi:hypothetical protein